MEFTFINIDCVLCRFFVAERHDSCQVGSTWSEQAESVGWGKPLRVLSSPKSSGSIPILGAIRHLPDAWSDQDTLPVCCTTRTCSSRLYFFFQMNNSLTAYFTKSNLESLLLLECKPCVPSTNFFTSSVFQPNGTTCCWKCLAQFSTCCKSWSRMVWIRSRKCKAWNNFCGQQTNYFQIAGT